MFYPVLPVFSWTGQPFNFHVLYVVSPYAVLCFSLDSNTSLAPAFAEEFVA